MKQITLLICITLLFPAAALAASGTGSGLTKELALRAALQNAVESDVGMYLSSNSVVENIELLKDTVASHAHGFVKSYKLLSDQVDADGVWTVEVSAIISRDVFETHVSVLETLMKLGGHPTVGIMADNSDMAAISLNTEVFTSLMEAVQAVFRDDFRFDIMPSDGLRASLNGAPTLNTLKKAAPKLGLDFIVAVSILKARNDNLSLVMHTFQVANGTELGAFRVPLHVAGLSRLKGKPYFEAVAEAATQEVFSTSIKAAQSVVSVLHEEVEGGNGTLYRIVLIDFKEVDAIIALLENTPGFVSIKPVSRTSNRCELDLRSHLGSAQLHGKFHSGLSGAGLKVLHKQEGSILKYKTDIEKEF